MDGLWALLFYACLSTAVFGHAALTNLGHAVVGFGQSPAFYGRDQSAFVWFLAWGAHALAHLQNPFITHEVFAPRGYNLAWAASILGPALLLAPVTWTLGAVPTFNLLAMSAPATSAWTAYLLCREVTARRSSALVGGLVFGFGTYETTEMVNHLNLALVALLPLAALLALRRYRGATSRRRFTLGLAVTLGAQAWTSTEVLASSFVFGALALATAYCLADTCAQRRSVCRLTSEAAAAGAGALAIGAPYLWYACTAANPLARHVTVGAGADLANLLVPTRLTLLHGGPLASAGAELGGNLTEQLAYVGPLLPALLLAFVVEQRARWLARSVAAFTATAALLSLGGTLIVAGHKVGVLLPWALIGQLPLLQYALPSRFALYVWLGGACAVALWLDRPRHRALRWAAAATTAVALLPDFLGRWDTPVDNPPLLSSRELSRYVPPHSVVLALPFGIDGNSMYWQVQADFAFSLAGGYVSFALPSAYRRLSIIHELTGRPPGGQLARRLCAFIAMTGTQTILLRDHTVGDWPAILRPLHIDPVHVGGFAIYRLDGCPTTR